VREWEFVGERIGSANLWLARIVSAPHLVSPVHHHGESEAAFYVLRGSLSFFFGEGLRQRVDLSAGDSIYIPAWTIHAEGNLGAAECDVIAARSTATPTSFHLPELRIPEDVLAPAR
jgi:uncharacterized RmlC-like cupin family protein